MAAKHLIQLVPSMQELSQVKNVRIAFTYAALNDLDVCMADIRDAYLQSPTSQKHYIICGPEFGMENVGKVAIMHRAVNGGKTSGRDFRKHLRSCMEFINITSCPADLDVWMRPAIKSDVTDVWHMAHIWVSYGRCTMPGSPIGRSEGLSRR